MADLDFVPLALPADRDALADWLASDTWPFHGNPSCPRAEALEWIDAGRFASPEAESFWVVKGGSRVGLIRLFDLDDIPDGAPLFDLRLRTACRGRGIGTAAVRWLTRRLFERHSALRRIEGTTRCDNRAMRRVFLRCGYVKEGQHRQSWPTPDGARLDSVHYAILRGDWESGTTTPVEWDDEPTDPA